MVGWRDYFKSDGPIKEVQGFITPRSIRAIHSIIDFQNRHSISGSLSEIGTYRGKTFVGLALSSRDGERVVGLDIFPGDVQQSLVNHLNKFLEQSQKSRVVLVKKDSSTVSFLEWAQYNGSKTRFVHVDGNHTKAAVQHDILLASSYLSEGGVVLIDDFLHDFYPDVTEGILETLNVLHNIVPVAVIPRSGRLLDGGTKLLCVEKSYAEPYTSLIISEFSEIKPRQVSFAGSKLISFIVED